MSRRKVQDTRTRHCLLCRTDLPLRRFLAGDGGRGTATRCRDCLAALQVPPPPSRQGRRATTCRYCPRPPRRYPPYPPRRYHHSIIACAECAAVHNAARTRPPSAVLSPASLQRRIARIREILEDHGPLGSNEIAIKLGIAQRWALWALSRSGLPRTLRPTGRGRSVAIWNLPGARPLPAPSGIDLDGLPNPQDAFHRALAAAEVRLRAQALATVRQLVVDGRPVTPAGQRYLDSFTITSATR